MKILELFSFIVTADIEYSAGVTKISSNLQVAVRAWRVLVVSEIIFLCSMELFGQLKNNLETGTENF